MQVRFNLSDRYLICDAMEGRHAHMIATFSSAQVKMMNVMVSSDVLSALQSGRHASPVSRLQSNLQVGSTVSSVSTSITTTRTSSKRQALQRN